jgi:single-strand DNA-binding protein
MPGINRVIMIGNVGRDPQIIRLKSGEEAAGFDIAVNEFESAQDGSRKERVEWVRVIVRASGLVELSKNYVRKGVKIYVEGAWRSRMWTDDRGIKRTIVEVQLAPFNSKLVLLTANDGQERAPLHVSEALPADQLDAPFTFDD